MFRLLRLILALIATFAAVIFAVRLIVRTQPSPVAVLFSNPDGTPCERPCLFGIQPGKTTRAEALRLLKTHPITSEFQTRPLVIDDPVIVKSPGNHFSGKKMVINFSTGREETTIDHLQFYLLAVNSETNRNVNSKNFLSISTFGEFISILGKYERMADYEEENGTPVIIYSFPEAGVVVDVRITDVDDLLSGSVTKVGIQNFQP